MANEIKVNNYTDGVTVYFVVENAAGQMYRSDTNVYEAYSDSHWANYAIAMTENGTSGRYRGNFPTVNTPAGWYNITARQQIGGSPALGDSNIGSTDLTWNGTAHVYLNGNGTGGVELDLTQAVPTSNTDQTVGDALNAARANGFGKWVLSGTSFLLYAADETTIVKTFTLDSSTNPTQRT